MSRQKYPQNATTTNGGTKPARRLKENGYSNATLHAKRDKKRAEAEARQRAHDALTPEAKYQKALVRRGTSHRELARLEKARS